MSLLRLNSHDFCSPSLNHYFKPNLSKLIIFLFTNTFPGKLPIEQSLKIILVS